ncbi:MAG: hypothetical protein GTO18_10120 [Anaerolineales bacterium]|nr:hypothetical protein [Anaerolineales bacterium]
MSTPSIQHRLFWTWDHSMDWIPLAKGVQEFGCGDPYYKDADAFVEDYKRLIDFGAEHGYNGIVIYGFLRDTHGGIEASQEICHYGKEKGVPIIPGVGVLTYGGVYWEGDHEFNLSNWLERNPHLVGELPRVDNPFIWWHRIGCPSKVENQQWMQDAVQWLCETFDIGGINLETGDYGICVCDDCRKKFDDRPEHPKVLQIGDNAWSLEDMAELLPPLIDIMQKVDPEMLPICDAYFDYFLDPQKTKVLNRLPQEAIIQFSVTGAYWPKVKEEMDVELIAEYPPQRTILRTEMGSQWYDGARFKLVAREFGDLTKLVADLGMEGISIWGEVSASEVANEINYLSVSYFADNSDASWEKFVKDALAPLLGGEENAFTFIYLIEKDQVMQSDLDLAKKTLLYLNEPAYRRWVWLISRIYRRLENPGWAPNQRFGIGEKLKGII